MKTLLIALLVIVLAGCGATRLTKDGEKTTFTSFTLFKTIKDVDAEDDGDTFKFKLGQSVVDMTDAQAEAIMCGLMPQTCEQ